MNNRHFKHVNCIHRTGQKQTYKEKRKCLSISNRNGAGGSQGQGVTTGS